MLDFCVMIVSQETHFLTFTNEPRNIRNPFRNSQLLAKFKLCPKNSNQCRNAGDYVIPMDSFVAVYSGIIGSDSDCAAAEETCIASCQDMADEYQNQYSNEQDQNQDDQQNEEEGDDQANNGGNQYANYAQPNYNYGYNSNNNNGNNRRHLEQDSYYFDYNGCLSQCMSSVGMSSCEDTQGGNTAGMEDMVQCHEVADSVYVGASCRKGGVYMGTFTDSACTQRAATGTYKQIVRSMYIF